MILEILSSLGAQGGRGTARLVIQSDPPEKGERVKIQGYLEDFALSKAEADELIMSARNIVYKD